MKRVVIFVFSKDCISKLEESFIRYNEATIVSLTAESDYFLRKKGYRYKSILDYNIKAKTYKQVYLERVRLFNKWVDSKINGKTLCEHLMVNDLPVLDLLESFVGELHLEVIMIYAGIVKGILEQERPQQVIFYNYKGFYTIPRYKVFFPDLITEVCAVLDIPTKIVKSFNPFLKPFQALFNSSVKHSMLHKTKQRKKFAKYSLKDKKRVLMFLYGFGMDKTYPVEQKLIRKGIDVINICSGGVKINNCQDFFSSKPSMFAYNESFIDEEISRKVLMEQERLSKVFALLKQNKHLFVSQGINLFTCLEHTFSQIFNYQLIQVLTTIFTFEKIFKEMKPSFIVTVNDSVFYGKCATLYAKRYGVKSLLIQHAGLPDISSILTPLSDHIAIWQEYKRLKGNKRYIVTGSTKLPFKKERFKEYNKKQVKKELGIAPDKRVILFAARYPTSRDFFRLQEVYDLVQTNSNLVAIIKQHPAEVIYPDKRLKKLFACKQMMFYKDIDFHKLLVVSDVVISTRECTTSVDTIMMEKPLIIYSLEESFNQPWSEDKEFGDTPPFLEVLKKGDLQKQVLMVLSDYNTKQKLKQRMVHYNTKNFSFKMSDKKIAKFIQSQI